MSTIWDPNKFIEALNTEIKRQVDEAINKAIVDAKIKIEYELKKELARISLNLLEHYRVDRNEHEIIIHVKNDISKG